MVYTQHFCAKCGSDQIWRTKHSQGRARCQCKVYRRQVRFMPAAVAKAAQYEQVDQLGVRTQFAAQHRARDRRFAHEHCQADKKK